MIDAALIAALQADSGVSAHVSGRVFVVGGRQGTLYPYISVQRISTAGANHLNGPNTLEWPRFQIDCWASPDDPSGGALKALAVADAVRSAIDQITIAGDPTFTATFQDQSGPSPDPETRSFRVQSDYLLFHSR